MLFAKPFKLPSNIPITRGARKKIKHAERRRSVARSLGGCSLGGQGLVVLPHSMCLATSSHTTDVHTPARAITALSIVRKTDLPPISCPADELIVGALAPFLLVAPAFALLALEAALASLVTFLSLPGCPLPRVAVDPTQLF